MGEQGGINLYGYVGNNPVNAVDLLGLDSCDCAKLRARIDLLNQQFNSASAALGDMLSFQYDSAATLYRIDRYIDAISGGIGGAVGSAVKETLLANATASASGTLTARLVAGGTLQRAGSAITRMGKAMNAATAWGAYGVYGSAAGFATKKAIQIPGDMGTNGVRDQIQNTINSIDAELNSLAGTLADLRRQYRANCGSQ